MVEGADIQDDPSVFNYSLHGQGPFGLVCGEILQGDYLISCGSHHLPVIHQYHRLGGGHGAREVGRLLERGSGMLPWC